MGDFYELSQKRQSCRNFDETRRVEHEKLVRCIEAARNAPSGCNSQPWSFIVVETPELVREVAKAGQQIDMNPFLDGAQAFIVVIEEHARLMPKIRPIFDSQYFAPGDLGGAIVHILLMAESMGIGSCQIGIFDRDRLRELLDIPADKRFASCIIALGYPKNPAVLGKKRKPLSEIARFV